MFFAHKSGSKYFERKRWNLVDNLPTYLSETLHEFLYFTHSRHIPKGALKIASLPSEVYTRKPDNWTSTRQRLPGRHKGS